MADEVNIIEPMPKPGWLPCYLGAFVLSRCPECLAICTPGEDQVSHDTWHDSVARSINQAARPPKLRGW